MNRHTVVVDSGVEVSAAELAAAWNGDDEARSVGVATVETAPPGDFLGAMELVVIPAGVGLAVNGVSAMVGSLITRLRAKRDQPELEISRTTKANGDEIIVVRLRELPK